MTIINNGERRSLVIEGVIDGVCGTNRGRLAFIPNRVGRKALQARGGLLDGQPIKLIDVALSDDGRSYTARFEKIQ